MNLLCYLARPQDTIWEAGLVDEVREVLKTVGVKQDSSKAATQELLQAAKSQLGKGVNTQSFSYTAWTNPDEVTKQCRG